MASNSNKNSRSSSQTDSPRRETQSFAERTRLRKSPRSIDSPEQRALSGFSKNDKPLSSRRTEQGGHPNASSSRTRRGTGPTSNVPRHKEVSRSPKISGSSRTRLYADDRIREHAFREIDNRRARAETAQKSAELQSKRSQRQESRTRTRDGKRALSSVKQERRAQARRVKAAKQIALLLSALILISLSIYGISSFLHSSFFYADDVQVTDLEVLDADLVKSMASIDTSSSALFLKKKDIEERINKNPWLESVKVKVKLPNTVVIDAQEYTPLARVVLSASESWLIARDGSWIAAASADLKKSEYKLSQEASQTLSYDSSALIEITNVPDLNVRSGEKTNNPEILNAIEVILGVSKELRADIKSLSAASVATTKIFTKEGIEIAFGPAKDAVEKDRIARSIMEKEKGRVVLINVRAIDKPTWRGISSKDN